MPSTRRIVRLGGLILAVAAATAGGIVVASDAPHRAVASRVASAVTAPPTQIARPVTPNTRSVVVAAPSGVGVFDRPDGKVVRTLAGHTDLGAVQTMLTVGGQGGWWKVALPVRPNDATGWVRKVDVRATTIDTRIEIDRKAHRLTLLRGGKVVQRYPVAVGAKATPTPAGRFYITDNLSTGNPSGSFGPYALGLSGRSDVLFQFGSGDGVLGIHGTNQPGSIGTDASHGCIRMRNADITGLRARMPLGAPVLVS